MFGNLGPFEMLLVAGIALLLFGKNLPKVAGDLGRSWKEFRDGMAGVGRSVEDAVYARPASSNSWRPNLLEQQAVESAPKFESPMSVPGESTT